MNIAIYTKTGCSSCVKAKNLLHNRSMAYDEVQIGKDITREEFMGLFPGVMMVPFIIIDEVEVGGYEQLVEYISKQG
jgi:glutaredoxin